MSLLWLLAVTALLVILQWSTLWQWLAMFTGGLWLIRRPMRPNFSIDTSQDVLHWQCRGASGVLSQLYQTEYWSVLVLHVDPEQPLLYRLWHYLCRYRWLYRDQLSDADYRYLRSRLNVEKLLGLPTQKNESSASK
ncbi:hypothetical protein MAQ5080_01062 [Marinomonas aquimarina]|uniref:Uncharacterized protein n=1 Tax=Marinomonas aquimarina TaxID=295068 RepID=A0A1A8T8Q0_9GAMM|nr:hypothetical protein [Marinomonas aquimarina]SBS28279.1 hypothetical protein MAQ5080_01062 [Marinomonas aquimarina]